MCFDIDIFNFYANNMFSVSLFFYESSTYGLKWLEIVQMFGERSPRAMTSTTILRGGHHPIPHPQRHSKQLASMYSYFSIFINFFFQSALKRIFQHCLKFYNVR